MMNREFLNLFYFVEQFEEAKPAMVKNINKKTT